MHRTHLITLAIATAALAVGCGSDPKPGPQMANAATTATDANRGPATQHQDTATPTSGSIHIDDKILKACGNIPTAHFAFDSAKIDASVDAALGALARCFATGPLAGHSMLLTGHTDPRGEVEYNMGLGQRRAGSVASYIEAHGVAHSHVATTSRGAEDATGTDEEGWARDRKVNVTLAD